MTQVHDEITITRADFEELKAVYEKTQGPARRCVRVARAPISRQLREVPD